MDVLDTVLCFRGVFHLSPTARELGITADEAAEEQNGFCLGHSSSK